MQNVFYSRRRSSLASAVVAFAFLHAACDRAANSPKQASVAEPTQASVGRALTQAPALSGSGESGQKSAEAFISWASNSLPGDREAARAAIAAASNDSEVATAVGEVALRSYQADSSRALVALSILGEMRNGAGTGYLKHFLNMPLPQAGTVVEGEILEQTAVASLQAKAVDGLAYLRNAEGDEAVLRAVREHPSKIVRAEAIDAYLWNHGDSEEARQTLRGHVRQGEEIFLERIRRVEGQSGEEFNQKLAAYLQAHPELIPPDPQRVSSGAVEKPEANAVSPGEPPSAK
jgi:hypothetical protein